jgi:hypothetical protein
MAKYGSTTYGSAVYSKFETNWKTTDYINSADFVRVESETENLKDVLIDTFGSTISITTDETWDNTGFPYYDELNRIESNVEAIKDNWVEPIGWITPKEDWATGSINQGTNLTAAQMMNRIETDLSLLYTTITASADYLLPCGTFKAGGDHIRQHFTR